MPARFTKRALLIATTWWAGPAKLAVALSQHGWQIEGICSKDHPFRYVSKVTRRYSYSYRDPIASLLYAINSGEPDVLVPCDDAAVSLLHALHGYAPDCRALIERSIGPASSYAVAKSRLRLMKLARELEIRIPESSGIQDAGELGPWFSRHGQSHVLKRDGSFGGKGVAVVHSLAGAERAFHSISQPPTFLNRLSRWLALGDPLAFWHADDRPEIIVQQFIQGRPANILFVCFEGRVLASICVEVLVTEGSTGAALVAKLIDHPEMQLAAEKVARSLHLSGFSGLDFMLEGDTDKAYLIEMNPRCTQLGHVPIDGQGDLARFLDTSVPSTHQASAAAETQILAFFPQILWSLKDPVSHYPIYLDVPWLEPALVTELTKRDWRERRLLGLLYARLFPRKRAAVAWSNKLKRSSPPPLSGDTLPAD